MVTCCVLAPLHSWPVPEAPDFVRGVPRLDPVTKGFRLTWPSILGETYSVFFSDGPALWKVADDNVLSAGSITLWLDPIGPLPDLRSRFYSVMENK